VVRELATAPDYPGNPQWIAERIIPQVSEEEVKNAIELLASLKLISRDTAKGKWQQTDTVISSSSSVRSRAAIAFHTAVITLARESLERFKSEQRDIRAITLKLSPKGFVEAKRRLETVWRELLAFSESQKDADTVYQINMQLFPLSGPGEEGKP
jgi:uncharacterized protein (TIGR02147 family)